MGIANLRTCHFEASEDIMTKSKSQALHVTIKSNSGSGNPPFLIPALWNIGILLNKGATSNKHSCTSSD